MKKKVIMSWSSGKDSAWALYQLQQNPKVEVVGLCCSINQKFQRVAMHGVRVELLKKQAEALALPIDIIELPFPCTNEDYQRIMDQYFSSLVQRGIEAVAFGDLFLEDVKRYREQMLAKTKLQPLFPIWNTDTTLLASQLINTKFRAITTCVDGKRLSAEHVGKEFSQEFIQGLPPSADPCGENGEFHTFVFDAPNFSQPIAIELGEIVERDSFIFIDAMPTNA